MKAMSIQETLDILRKAQEADREIYKIRQEIASIPGALEDLNEAYASEKKAMSSLEARSKEVQLRQKQKEGELAEKENLVRKYDSQLTQVKTNKEYTALKHEMEVLKADGSLIEDQILVIFDEIEKIQIEVRAERERLARVEKETEEKKKHLAAREAELKNALAAFTSERQERVQQLDPESRTLYDRIVEKKEGLALVPVLGEICGACRITIRPQLLNEVNLKESLIVCENCSRILYQPE